MSRPTRMIGVFVGGVSVGLAAAITGLLFAETPAAEFGAVDLLRLLAGWSFVAGGLLAWARQPANRLGALLVLIGVSFLTTGLANSDHRLVRDAVAWIQPIHLPIFTHALLAFPTGRLGSRPALAVVLVLYLVMGPLYHLPLIVGEPALGPAFTDAASAALAAVLFVAGSALLVRRWIAGSYTWRRNVALLLWPGALTLAALALFNAAQVVDLPIGLEAAMWAFRLAFVAMPYAFLAALLRSQLARGSVADLVMQLEESSDSGSLRDALARSLGDPSLTIAYWLPNEHRYVDIDGQPFDLPPERDGVVTTVERDGRQVAAIVHDRALGDDPALVRAAAAAAALALDRERLQAELRAQLDELSVSRARLLLAADSERRRIERALHDGTQQRLTSVAIALGMAESQIAASPEQAAANIAQARSGLTAALSELREISQGIHPGGLRERGLEAALKDLAYASAVPVAVTVSLDKRPPERIEAAAYYIVAEALANVVKHAHATSARVSVSDDDGQVLLSVTDDGRGGADAARGTGIRGLADRLHALGGTLLVESAEGRGTTVRAVIPCA